MLAVGVATVLTCLVNKRSLASLGWGWGSWKYQWMSYLLPLLIALISSVIIWLTPIGDWYNTVFVQQQMQDYNLEGWSETSVIVFHFILTAT